MKFTSLLAQDTPVVPEPNWGGIAVLAIIIIIVLFVAIVGGYWIIYQVRHPKPKSLAERNTDSIRSTLALNIVLASVIGVAVFAIVSVITAEPDEKSAVSQQVMTAILPLLGTWVGTVMAFYFGQKNFESAAQQTESAALSGGSLATKLDFEGLLKSKLVSDPTIMLPIEKAFYVKLAAGDRNAAYKAQNLEKIVADLDAAGAKQNAKWYRIPVLDDQMRPVFVVHRSIIDEFINQQTAAAADPKATRATLTLYDLYQDPYFKGVLNDSVVILAANMTLKDAKDAMAYKKNCQDVFVTKMGGSNEAVVGWITNNNIQDAAKV